MVKTPFIQLALCGSADGEQLPEVNEKMARLGQEIAKRNIVLLSGACHGYPYQAALSHFKNGGLSIGVSPAKNYEEHINVYRFPTDCFQSIIFTSLNIKARNVVFAQSADIVICVGGGAGTMNEFTIAYDEGTPIGIVKGSGGISDDFAPLAKKFYKKPRHTGIVIEDSDPLSLLEKLIPLIKRV